MYDYQWSPFPTSSHLPRASSWYAMDQLTTTVDRVEIRAEVGKKLKKKKKKKVQQGNESMSMIINARSSARLLGHLPNSFFMVSPMTPG